MPEPFGSWRYRAGGTTPVGMFRRRFHWLLTVVAGLTAPLLLAATPTTAHAAEGSVTAQPDRFGIVAVDSGRGSSYFRVGQGGGSAANPCDDISAYLFVGADGKTMFDYDSYVGAGPTPVGLREVEGKPEQPAQAYAAYCPGSGGSGVITGWLTAANRLDLAAAINSAISEVRDHLTPPTLELGRNPNVDGLVGLDTYYWVTNYSGQTLTRTVDAFPGFRITVEARPSDVSWNFGDGFNASGGFGAPFGTAGTSVTHRYARHGSYDTTASVTFSASYHINNGAAVVVAGTVTRSGTVRLRVLEAQALIKGGGASPQR